MKKVLWSLLADLAYFWLSHLGHLMTVDFAEPHLFSPTNWDKTHFAPPESLPWPTESLSFPAPSTPACQPHGFLTPPWPFFILLFSSWDPPAPLRCHF